MLTREAEFVRIVSFVLHAHYYYYYYYTTTTTTTTEKNNVHASKTAFRCMEAIYLYSPDAL